jgi:hypothetical protein
MEIYQNLSLEDLPNEEWRDVVGYEGLYQVSNFGRVKRLNCNVYKNDKKSRNVKEKILSQYPRNGYLRVRLLTNGRQVAKVVHRLVAIAFVENSNNYIEVNHKDENKYNNLSHNLEWCDRSYNCSYGSIKERFSKRFKGKKRVSKPIFQYTIDGKFVKEWKSGYEIRKSKFSRGCVIDVCNGIRKTANGYFWSYNQL